ncbi:hypothetical protein CI109_101042 [Kwoniella shandongensis]|uniref:Uncharacterized protein n=1 Tax=Kwoniella shandongensis TaxID=1734106 RepID=A0A5M6C4K8_9TREE|nr:uncharacterized protein CI109_001511 [Kwoniella shandongensis]KAA5530107.1 hypothetical protein CI109_001511 [Kwoniella shandongensis]
MNENKVQEVEMSDRVSVDSAPLPPTNVAADTSPSSDQHGSATPPSFPQLTTTPTSLSTRSARQVIASFPTSSHNPYNWSKRKKISMATTLAATGFISTAGSSVGVPGMHAVMAEFGVTNEMIGVLIAGAYVLGLGTGPFLFAPISELYGRQPAYFSSQTLYVIFFLATGFSRNMTTLIILRFFCGVFGSVTPSLGVATCADMFSPQERGTPIALYALGPMAGPVLGNMLGTWFLFFGWRWPYYFMTIVSAVNTVVMILVMRETYAPALQKILTYHATHPKADSSGQSFVRRILPDLSWMPAMVSRADMRAVYGRAFSRPPRLLFTNPVAFGFSIYYAYTYAIIYMFLVALPLLYGRPPWSHVGLFSYSWPQSTMPLSYLSMGLGFVSAAAIAANCQDRIYKYLSARSGDKGQPEYRLVLTQIGMCTMPIGLLIFGWTANAQVHWIGPFIGQYIIGVGLMLAFNTLQNFFVDAFYPYSAAAIAGATACRSIIACILPLFATDMFVKLGWGWGGTLLALVGVVGIPGPLIMFICGKRLRERFAFDG